jgi:DNA-binding response OmpR family regulator
MKSDYQQAIALVDDDEDAVNLFTYFLRENGYDVVGFTDPLLLLDYILHHDSHFVWLLSTIKCLESLAVNWLTK